MDVNRLHADLAWCKNKILALQTLCKFGFGKVLLLSLEHLIWLQSRRPPPPPPPHCDHMPCLRNEQGVYTNGFHLHVSPPPSVPTPPSLSLSPLSVIVLHFVSAGTKGSELFDCEDGCHTDQCQQPQTWHHICLPHPALLHASPRLVPVLLPSVLCLLFYFFLLHFLLVFSVLLLLLIAASHRLRRLQRSPGAADTRRMWVLVSHLQPPKTGTGVRSGTWRVLLNHAAEMTNGCNPFFVPNPTVELWKGIKNYVPFQYHFLEPNIFITKIKDIRLKEPSTITFSFSRGRVLCKDNFFLNMQNFSWDVLYINKYKWMLMCKKFASIMWLEWKFIATGTHKAQLSRLYLSFICVWLNIISCVHWQRRCICCSIAGSSCFIPLVNPALHFWAASVHSSRRTNLAATSFQVLHPKNEQLERVWEMQTSGWKLLLSNAFCSMHIQFVCQPEARSSVSDYGAQEAAAAQPLVATGQVHAGEKAF